MKGGLRSFRTKTETMGTNLKLLARSFINIHFDETATNFFALFKSKICLCSIPFVLFF